MNEKRARIGWLLLFTIAGCHDSDGSYPSNGGSGGVTAVDSDAAGMAGGRAVGSGSGTGGGEELSLGGLPVSDLCSPGEYSYMTAITCQPTVGGLMTEGTRTLVESVELPVPMTAGQPYSISLEHKTSMETPAKWIEDVYGVMSMCAEGGETAELLGTQMLDRGNGTYCLTFTPQKAYTYLLLAAKMVGREAFMARGGYQFCPTVGCPDP